MINADTHPPIVGGEIGMAVALAGLASVRLKLDKLVDAVADG
jgi:hypothetical protein